MPYNGMTAHISGTSLSAQTRYAAGTLEILQKYFEGTPTREEYLIVDGGALQARERDRTSWRDSD
jgi:formate dehydrogenase